jgi:hypothetical protein
MDTISKTTGEERLDMASTAALKLKEAILLANQPLTPSQLSWLRQQSNLVAEAYQQSLSKR